MERLERDNMSIDVEHEQNVFPTGSGIQDRKQISSLVPFTCSCGNEASPIEHDGVYCSIICAHDDTYEALVNGSSTSHYYRIQKARRSPSLNAFGIASSEKGKVISRNDALHDHAYMSIEEWVSLDTGVEDATSPSDDIDATLKKSGELAQKARSKEAKQPVLKCRRAGFITTTTFNAIRLSNHNVSTNTEETTRESSG